jgi:hypothetical protein
MCDGVPVYCDNANQANYWWRKIALQPTGGCGTDDWWCCVNDQCWEKVYSITQANHWSDMGEICVGHGVPEAVDPNQDPVVPLDDWRSQGETGNPPGWYPEIDREIRTACSKKCKEQSAGEPDLLYPALEKVCEDGNWTAQQTGPDYTPTTHGYQCIVPKPLNEDDPDGSLIPWDLVGGPSSPVPVACDLDDDCADWFYPSIGRFIRTPGSAHMIDPETRFAHYLGIDGSGSQLTLDPGQGTPDTQPLYGIAEYTAIDCLDPTGAPADVCPFYLANLMAYNTTSSWNLRLVMTSGPPRNKEISDVQIDLLQSTLGVHHKSLDKVAFAPGALRMRVEFEVAGNQSLGNGTHVYLVENEDDVFADYDDGELTISHAFAFQNGTATLSVTVVPDEHPPLAAHDLGGVEACDVYQPSPWGGLLLDQTRSLSTDPDDDIVLEIWWVDGEPCGHGCVVPVGSHVVSLEAHDSRGAVHRTADHSIEVQSGSACIPT